MRRREVLQLLAGAMMTAPSATHAQTTSKVYRVGTLTVRPPMSPTAGTGKILIDGLAQRGFVLGQNLVYEALAQILISAIVGPSFQCGLWNEIELTTLELLALSADRAFPINSAPIGKKCGPSSPPELGPFHFEAVVWNDRRSARWLSDASHFCL